jgi:ParB-like chromosome segregation protein Spo0J
LAAFRVNRGQDSAATRGPPTSKDENPVLGFFLEKMMREQHPLSAAFPAMSEEEFQELKDSIENIGVQTPIVIFENKVIDGWHRYTAANDVGMPCPESDLDEDIDPRDFVLASNKSRRHLTKSQLALSYAKVYEWAPEGKPSNSQPGLELKTAKELAKLSGASTTTIEQVKKVLKDGDENVIKAVESGKISAKRGAEISRLPKDQQSAAIDEPRPSILDGNVPDDEELRANELAIQADMDAMSKFLEADDKMAELAEENKRLRYLVAQKDIRIASLMNEKNTAVKMVKDLQRQVDKFHKAKK